MSEDEIQAIKNWLFASKKRNWVYVVAKDDGKGEEFFVSAEDFPDFIEYLNENAPWLGSFVGRIDLDGVWFDTEALKNSTMMYE